MGCGIKAWREEEEDRAYNAKVKKFKEKDIVEVMLEVEKMKEALLDFTHGDLHLTRNQWARLEYLEKKIDKVLK